MTMTDPISDMLTRIRNALMAMKNELEMPSSKMKVEIAKLLKEEGYIDNYRIIPDIKQNILKLTLKYGQEEKRIITGLERVSKPGRRMYCSKDKIPEVLNGLGINILSTSKGVITGEKARKIGVGGEILCNIW
jgi:small subunit ribosomal protein S8